MTAVTEAAPGKVNLVLRVGEPGADGLHPLCSLFARLDLADTVTVEPADADEVVCPGVDGPNLATAAVRALRERVDLPPLLVTIEKHLPVAAGLAGGSADAAATLRAANTVAGAPLDADGLRAVARGLGSDVPSQVEPASAVVHGTGERVDRVELAPMGLVLLPDPEGLATGAVYGQLDRLRAEGEAPAPAGLDPGPLKRLAGAPPAQLATRLENDLQLAALWLRPELGARIDALRAAGAHGALVSGSGPTVFGVFDDREAAQAAAAGLPGALVAQVSG